MHGNFQKDKAHGLLTCWGLRFLVGVSPGGCYPDPWKVVPCSAEMRAEAGVGRCAQREYRLWGRDTYSVARWFWWNMARDRVGAEWMWTCTRVRLGQVFEK
jgi:hypothetical protein